MRRLLVIVAAAASLTLPGAAWAASGSATLSVSLKAAEALDARGISLSVVTPAERSTRDITTPVASATVASTATVGIGGSIRLRRGARSVTLSSLRIQLGSRASITAVLGGSRTTIWTLAPRSGSLRIDPASASARLAATPATLSKTAAVAIARRLGTGALPRASFLKLAVDAAGTSKPAPAPTGGTALPAYCRAQSQGGAPLDIGTGEPAVKARPATAVDLTSASIAWHPRESFVAYIASGEGTSVAGGASADPPETLPGTSAALTYTFHFPFAHGWCDPVTGSAAIYGSGSVRFRYGAHGIDLVVNDPEIEIDGAASRVIFRMTGGDDTPGGNRREVVETLDLSKSTSISVSPDAKTFDYLQMPGAVPQGADTSIFAGYYLPGEEFGWASVQFFTP